ncbi:DUF3318 domain-containing protein [Oculatella sp. LEGE 06141]|uniref:DUF3318 domain-containing protein n=1 Tax=Oculatella sp. LEGE 06141 TaxID=1828648 RepID=UPI001882A789|nr:DUF3318 domain-containing protein [Oculatella sp. LEGE 06141]MBE9182726.1 DUF3318 domain-containing protein [Oculatella sp. LEGE 06141]
MNLDSEIYRLIDLMPASGRMYCKILDKPDQTSVIQTHPPLPWQQARPIGINFGLWEQLTRPQRDLLLLRTVGWLTTQQMFKLGLPQGLAAAGVVATLVELVQVDPVGIVTAGGLTVLAASQIWRKSRGTEAELEADEAGMRVAQRRGYSETDAASHLLSAIEAVAQIERRPLDFVELVRCQNLKAIAGLSSVGVPEPLRKE